MLFTHTPAYCLEYYTPVVLAHRLPRFTAHYTLPLRTTYYYPPLTTHRSPLTTHCSPPTTHCSPLTAHRSPLTTHHSLLTGAAHASGARVCPPLLPRLPLGGMQLRQPQHCRKSHGSYSYQPTHPPPAPVAHPFTQAAPGPTRSSEERPRRAGAEERPLYGFESAPVPARSYRARRCGFEHPGNHCPLCMKETDLDPEGYEVVRDSSEQQ